VSDPLPRPRADNAPVAKRIWSLQYIRDDTEILVGVDDGQSVIYEAARKEYEGLSYTFEIPPRSLRLVDAFGSGFNFDSFTTFYNEATLSLNWDGQVTSQDTPLTKPRYDVLDRLDFSADGTILAAGGRRGSTHIWNLSTNESIYEGFYAVRPDQPIYEGVYSLPLGDPISPDGFAIALVVPKTIKTSDRTLTAAFYQIRNLSGAGSTRELTQTIDDAHVGYASNGSIFIAANLKQSKAWDYATGNETNLSGYPYTGCWITASANNLKDQLQVNSAAGIFPPTDNEHINSLCPKTYQFRGSMLAFSNDLSMMAFVNSSGLLEGYDVLAKTSPWPPYRLDSPVTAMAISPDGALIAFGDAAGRMRFIDGKTGQLVGEITGNFGRLEAIEFSEDGQKIATAGQDGLVRIFGIVEIQ
jgi:WD40 repeat protein